MPSKHWVLPAVSSTVALWTPWSSDTHQDHRHQSQNQHCILDLAPAYSSGVVKMYRAAGQQGPQAQPLGGQEGCVPGSGCVSPAIDRIRARLPVPSRPAWTPPMLRQLTETTGSRLWHRSILMHGTPETAQKCSLCADVNESSGPLQLCCVTLDAGPCGSLCAACCLGNITRSYCHAREKLILLMGVVFV